MRKTKKVVVYFGKERESLDPFIGFGEKRDVWYDFFQKAEDAGLEMYVSSGQNAYKGGYVFENILKYENKAFFPYANNIKADAIYDRSACDFFPDDEIASKTLNNKKFKDLCWNKNKTYELIGEFMPQSVEIENKEKLIKELAKRNQNELVVLKPASNFGGKGIYIDYPENLKNVAINEEYVMQDFIETAAGLEGSVDGRHDIRIVVVDDKIVLAHVRMPKDGTYLSNVAQGGSIKEVQIEKIPENIMSIISEIKQRINVLFDEPVYSIDFGVTNGKPYVFELNDQIGFPGRNMEKCDDFLCGLVNALAKRAAR